MEVQQKNDSNRSRPQDRRDSRTRQFNGQFVVPVKRTSNEFNQIPGELAHKSNDTPRIGSGGRSRRNSRAPSTALHAKGRRHESISMGQIDALERMSLKEPPAVMPGKQPSRNSEGSGLIVNGRRESGNGTDGVLSTEKGSTDTAGNVAPSLHTLSREFDALSKKLMALESNPSSANQSRSASEPKRIVPTPARHRGSAVAPSTRDRNQDSGRPPLIENPVLPSSLVGFDAMMAAEAQFRSRSGSAGSSASSHHQRRLPRLSDTPAGSHVAGRRGSTRASQHVGQLVVPRTGGSHNDSAVKSRHATPAKSPRKQPLTSQTSKTALRSKVPLSSLSIEQNRNGAEQQGSNLHDNREYMHKTPMLSIPGTASEPTQSRPLVPDINQWVNAISSSKDSEATPRSPVTQDTAIPRFTGYETDSQLTGVSSKGTGPAAKVTKPLLETAKPTSPPDSANGRADPPSSRKRMSAVEKNLARGPVTPVPERPRATSGLPYPTDSSSLQSSPIGFLTPTPRKGEEETMRYLSLGSSPGDGGLSLPDALEYPMFSMPPAGLQATCEPHHSAGKPPPQSQTPLAKLIAADHQDKKQTPRTVNDGNGPTSFESSDTDGSSSFPYPRGTNGETDQRPLNYKGQSPSKVLPSGRRSVSVNKPGQSRNPERPASGSNAVRVPSARARQNVAPRTTAVRPKSVRSRQGSAAPKQSLSRISNESGSRGFGDYGYDTATSGVPSETTTPTTQPLSTPRTAGENRTRGGRIRVLVRKRPLGGADTGDDCVRVAPPSGLHVEVTKRRVDLSEYNEVNDFEFDAVFSEEHGNADVYKQSALPLIETALEGGSASCFAYGQTGSGKTHTMMGTDTEAGLYLLTAGDLFKQLTPTQTVHVSLYEIYCNSLFDLLNNRAPLILREDANRQVNICGLTSTLVSNVDEVLSVVSQGSGTRSTGSTSANEHSSRSHAVLAISVFDSQDSKFCGTLNFVDLAGSERAGDTANNDKQTRLEGAEINKSLLALKECIRGLDERRKHIPFRGSKLTEVLRDSFSGNCRTVMIAAVSPSSDNYEHSLNTIRYAFRVKGLSVPTIGPSKARNAPRPYIPHARPTVSPTIGSNYRTESTGRSGNNNGSPSKPPRSDSKQRRTPQKYPYNPHSVSQNGGDNNRLWRPQHSDSLLPDIHMSNGVSRRSSEFVYMGEDMEYVRNAVGGDLKDQNSDNAAAEKRITEAIMQQLREEMGDRMRAMLAQRDATIASLTSENRVLRRDLAAMKKKVEQRSQEENGSGRGPPRAINDSLIPPTNLGHLPDISKLKRYTPTTQDDGRRNQKRNNQQNRGKANVSNNQQQLSKHVSNGPNQPTDESDIRHGDYPFYCSDDGGGSREDEWEQIPSKVVKPVKRTTARPVVQPKRFSTTEQEMYSDDEWHDF